MQSPQQKQLGALTSVQCGLMHLHAIPKKETDVFAELQTRGVANKDGQTDLF